MQNAAPEQTLHLPRDARCLACGYALRGLTQPLCPECGKSFSPADIMSFGTPRRARRINRRRRLAILPIVVWAIVCIAVAKFISVQLRNEVHPVLFVPALLLALIARRKTRRRILRSRRDPARSSERLFGAATMIACLLIVATHLGTDICPHAEYWFIGPVGIAYSDTGGPCWNHSNRSAQILPHWYLYHD